MTDPSKSITVSINIPTEVLQGDFNEIRDCAMELVKKQLETNGIKLPDKPSDSTYLVNQSPKKEDPGNESASSSTVVRSAITPTPDICASEIQISTSTLQQLFTATKTLQEQQMGVESLLKAFTVREKERFESVKEKTDMSIATIESLLGQFQSLKVSEDITNENKEHKLRDKLPMKSADARQSSQLASGNESDDGFSFCGSVKSESTSSRRDSIASDISIVNKEDVLRDVVESCEKDIRSVITPTPSCSGTEVQIDTSTLQQLVTATKTLQQQQLGLASLMRSMSIQQTDETIKSLKAGSCKNVVAITSLLDEFESLRVNEDIRNKIEKSKAPTDALYWKPIAIHDIRGCRTNCTSFDSPQKTNKRKQEDDTSPVMIRKRDRGESIEGSLRDAALTSFLTRSNSYQESLENTRWGMNSMTKLTLLERLLKGSLFDDARQLIFSNECDSVIHQVFRRVWMKAVWYNEDDSAYIECAQFTVNIHSSLSSSFIRQQRIKQSNISIAMELFEERCRDFGLCTPSVTGNRDIFFIDNPQYVKHYEQLLKIMRFVGELYNVNKVDLALIKWIILRLQITAPNIEQFATLPCNEAAIEMALVLVSSSEDKMCEDDTEYLFWVTEAINNISSYFAENKRVVTNNNGTTEINPPKHVTSDDKLEFPINDSQYRYIINDLLEDSPTTSGLQKVATPVQQSNTLETDKPLTSAVPTKTNDAELSNTMIYEVAEEEMCTTQ